MSVTDGPTSNTSQPIPGKSPKDSSLDIRPVDLSGETDYLGAEEHLEDSDPQNSGTQIHEPDLVQITPEDESKVAQTDDSSLLDHNHSHLKEEHIPRCLRCSYSLLGMAHAKGTCPECSKLFDLERPTTYYTYASLKSSHLKNARFCALVPMIFGTAVFLLYAITREDGLDVLGVFNIMCGNLFTLGGVIFLIAYFTKTKAPTNRKLKRMLWVFMLLLANYPLCVIYIRLVMLLGYGALI